MIRIRNLHAWYDESKVLHGVDLDLHEGEVVSLLGRNGAGRTTTIRSILGLCRRSGSIEINRVESIAMRPHQIARLGLGNCPEERGIFSSLSAMENLLLPPKLSDGGFSLEEIFDLFPNLKARSGSPGTRLSGGEQQMLAVARILRTGARTLLLDEISEGLAPVIVQRLSEVIQLLKAKGFSILLVEQNFRFAAPLADRFYVMEHGQVVHEFQARDLNSHSGALEKMLGI